MAMTTLHLPRIVNLSQENVSSRGTTKSTNDNSRRNKMQDISTMKIPDLIRHFEARKRKNTSTTQDSVTTRMIYTDQVLGRRSMDKYFDISKSYVTNSGKGPSPGRIKLPKIIETSRQIPAISDNETEDEYDRKWAKRAIKSLGADDEIVRAYANQTPQMMTRVVGLPPSEDRNGSISPREKRLGPSRSVKPKSIQQSFPLKADETKAYFQKRRVPQPLEANSLDYDSNNGSHTSNKRIMLNRKNKAENNITSTGGYHVTAKKFTPLGHVSVKTLAMAGNSSRDLSQKPYSHEHEISTDAGKRLLRSLFGRLNHEKRMENTREHSFKTNDKTSHAYHQNSHRNFKSNEQKDDKYGVVNFNQLPSELIGLHFQQTCENLWKYLNSTTDGKIKKELKKYFPTAKQRIMNKGKDRIYIPTGQPTDALFIEGISSSDETSGSELGTETTPVTLRLNHRKSNENSRCETNSFNLEEEMDKVEKSTDQPMRQSGIFYDQLTNKLTINIPAHDNPEAPPTTPVSRYSDCSFTEFDTNPRKVINAGNTRSVACSPLNFSTNDLRRSFGVPLNESNFTAKQFYSGVEFPLPPIMDKYRNKLKRASIEASQVYGELAPASSGNARVYKQGGYNVEIEQTVFKREHNDDKNSATKKPTVFMTTPPFTFSYMASKKSTKLKAIAIEDLKQQILTSDSSIQPSSDKKNETQTTPKERASKKRRARKKLRTNVNKAVHVA